MLRRIDHAMARTYSFTRAKSIQTTQRIHPAMSFITLPKRSAGLGCHHTINGVLFLRSLVRSP